MHKSRLTMIDFGAERLSKKLLRFGPDANVLVIIEGVFFYLAEAQIGATLDALRPAYPRHALICDLMTRGFIESRYNNNHEKVQKMDAPFKFFADQPCLTFTQAGYRLGAMDSIITGTFELRFGRNIASFFARILPKMAGGYSVCAFEIPANHINALRRTRANSTKKSSGKT